MAGRSGALLAVALLLGSLFALTATAQGGGGGGSEDPDEDGDGVPDDLDVCPGGDDALDLDADGIPDDCEAGPPLEDLLILDFSGDARADEGEVILSGPRAGESLAASDPLVGRGLVWSQFSPRFFDANDDDMPDAAEAVWMDSIAHQWAQQGRGPAGDVLVGPTGDDTFGRVGTYGDGQTSYASPHPRIVCFGDADEDGFRGAGEPVYFVWGYSCFVEEGSIRIADPGPFTPGSRVTPADPEFGQYLEQAGDGLSYFDADDNGVFGDPCGVDVNDVDGDHIPDACDADDNDGPYGDRDGDGDMNHWDQTPNGEFTSDILLLDLAGGQGVDVGDLLLSGPDAGTLLQADDVGRGSSTMTAGLEPRFLDADGDGQLGVGDEVWLDNVDRQGQLSDVSGAGDVLIGPSVGSSPFGTVGSSGDASPRYADSWPGYHLCYTTDDEDPDRDPGDPLYLLPFPCNAVAAGGIRLTGSVHGVSGSRVLEGDSDDGAWAERLLGRDLRYVDHDMDGRFGPPPSDSDGDGNPDAFDACPGFDDFGPDLDGDWIVDACDGDATDGPVGDADGDGVANASDACPGFDDHGPDGDGDGLVAGCDPDLNDGPTGDADGDGVANTSDTCPGHDDNGLDADGDGIIDACDGDDGDGPLGDLDGDGQPNASDPFPSCDDRPDADGDGLSDCADGNDSDGPTADADGDGVANAMDACPGHDDNGPDADGDGIVDACDDDETDGPEGDLDGDGIPNGTDAFPSCDDRPDADGDGTSDCADDNDNDGPSGDLDGDGILNGTDDFPECDDRTDADGDALSDCADGNDADGPDGDLDGDGLRNADDIDRDGDELLNDLEVLLGLDPDEPLAVTVCQRKDGGGVYNVRDLDGDGIPALYVEGKRDEHTISDWGLVTTSARSGHCWVAGDPDDDATWRLSDPEAIVLASLGAEPKACERMTGGVYNLRDHDGDGVPALYVEGKRTEYTLSGFGLATVTTTSSSCWVAGDPDDDGLTRLPAAA